MGKVVRLLADLLVELGQVFDLLFQRKPLFRFLVVGVIYLLLKVLYLFAQGFEYLIQFCPVLLGEFLRFLFKDFIRKVPELVPEIILELLYIFCLLYTSPSPRDS